MLGTLIFIGILFSAIVPMQLVMQQAETVKLQRIEEIKRFDADAQSEKISIVAYPATLTSDQLNIRVSNKGSITTKIVRIWIQDTIHTIDQSLNPGEVQNLGPFSVSLVEGASYPVKAITERGRVFPAEHVSLMYSNGQWFTPSLGIQVYISNDKGKYYIKVNNATWEDFYLTLGMDHGDLAVYFAVDTPGLYTVTCRKNTLNGPLLPGTPVNVELLWPSGPPILYVYTSGK